MPRRLKATVVRQIEELIAGRSYNDATIARMVGVHSSTVGTIRQGRHAEQRPPESRRAPQYAPPTADPTPEEIAERCAELRAKRHPEQPAWEFPVVSASVLQL